MLRRISPPSRHALGDGLCDFSNSRDRSWLCREWRETQTFESASSDQHVPFILAGSHAGDVAGNFGYCRCRGRNCPAQIKSEPLSGTTPMPVTDPASLNQQASALDAQGHFAEAERFYRQAQDIRRATLGEGNPATIKTPIQPLHSLGSWPLPRTVRWPAKARTQSFPNLGRS